MLTTGFIALQLCGYWLQHTRRCPQSLCARRQAKAMAYPAAPGIGLYYACYGPQQYAELGCSINALPTGDLDIPQSPVARQFPDGSYVPLPASTPIPVRSQYFQHQQQKMQTHAALDDMEGFQTPPRTMVQELRCPGAPKKALPSAVHSPWTAHSNIAGSPGSDSSEWHSSCMRSLSFEVSEELNARHA